jgi:TetR/AcrR family transcriptional regulator, transcriptional repressor for nem operon
MHTQRDHFVPPGGQRRRDLAELAGKVLVREQGSHGGGIVGRDPMRAGAHGSRFGEVPGVQVMHGVFNSCMMTIMRNSKPNARAAAKEASHERIVSVAARAIRRSGYDGTGVADIMKEAGLTHGAFYAHFPSREAMLAEAATRACAESAAATGNVVSAVPTEQALASMLRGYLSQGHRDHPEAGCPLAALGSETWRQAPEVRRATTRHIKAMVDLFARQSPDWGQPAAHERALLTIAATVGTLILARAVDEPALADSLCEAALKYLAPA